MFFFLRPNFKMDGFLATHIPLPVLLFLFPFCTLSVNLWEDDDDDEFWDDEP